MDEAAIAKENKLLADQPDLLDKLAERIREQPEPVDDYLRALAHSIIYAAQRYDQILEAIQQGEDTLDAAQRQEIREAGCTLGVDLTIKLRALHRAQEDLRSKHYLDEITPAEQLLGRLAQGFVLLIGLGYREEVPRLMMSNHELRQRLGNPKVAQWLIENTDEMPWQSDDPFTNEKDIRIA